MAPRVDLVPWLVAAAALVALVAQSARLWWIAARPGRRVRAAALRGAAGEARAEALLAARGYRIETRQAHQEFEFLVDGEPRTVAVRADLLVTRGGRRFVAEVKTGSVAPRPDHPPTRRQLLEYRHAFAADGVLLVQPEADAVLEIDFPVAAPARTPWLSWLLLGIVLGASGAALVIFR